MEDEGTECLRFMCVPLRVCVLERSGDLVGLVSWLQVGLQVPVVVVVGVPAVAVPRTARLFRKAQDLLSGSYVPGRPGPLATPIVSTFTLFFCTYWRVQV